MHLCIYPSIHIPTYLPTQLSICLSIYLSVCLSIYLSVCVSIYLFIYPSKRNVGFSMNKWACEQIHHWILQPWSTLLKWKLDPQLYGNINGYTWEPEPIIVVGVKPARLRNQPTTNMSFNGPSQCYLILHVSTTHFWSIPFWSQAHFDILTHLDTFWHLVTQHFCCVWCSPGVISVISAPLPRWTSHRTWCPVSPLGLCPKHGRQGWADIRGCPLDFHHFKVNFLKIVSGWWFGPFL